MIVTSLATVSPGARPGRPPAGGSRGDGPLDGRTAGCRTMGTVAMAPWFPGHQGSTDVEDNEKVALGMAHGTRGDTVARRLVGPPWPPLGFVLVSFTGKFADDLE